MTLARPAVLVALLAPGLVVAQDAPPPQDPLPWRGSSFAFEQSLNANTLDRGAQLSYDPTYAWSFDASLVWHFDDDVQASLAQALELELTDSNETTRRQRPLLDDTKLTLDARLWERRFAEHESLTVRGSGQLQAPTSLSSQAATMWLGARLGASASVEFEAVARGLTLALGGGYQHRFLGDNVRRAEVPYPCSLGGEASTSCHFLAGATTSRDLLDLVLDASVQLTDALGVGLTAGLAWSRGADLAEATFTTATGAAVPLPDASTTHFRNQRFVELSLSYSLQDWLGLSLLAANAFSERDPDGTLRSPGRPLDTTFGLRAELGLDALYLRAFGLDAPQR